MLRTGDNSEQYVDNDVLDGVCVCESKSVGSIPAASDIGQ